MCVCMRACMRMCAGVHTCMSVCVCVRAYMLPNLHVASFPCLDA